MCGRFAFYSPTEAVSQLFGIESPPEIEPRYNIAPTQFVPVVREDEAASRSISMLRWGLIPFWAKDKTIGNRLINARGETVAQKPSFRDSFRKRRCIVPVNGFYEWVSEGGAKQPYFISLGGELPFGLAGLWSSWKDKENDNEPLETFSIVTTSANASIKPYHHRMPVILPPENYQAWLSPANSDRDQLQTLLVPFESDALTIWPVSKMVNNARNEAPELVEPM